MGRRWGVSPRPAPGLERRGSAITAPHRPPPGPTPSAFILPPVTCEMLAPCACKSLGASRTLISSLNSVHPSLRGPVIQISLFE